MQNKTIYLPGLNGIRAIAAMAVVFGHTSRGFSHFGLENLNIGETNTYSLMHYGVTLFFVLSGFLITFLLREEKIKHNTISIKKFYMRRILRIWPLYFAYFMLCFLIYFIFKIDYETNSVPYYLFYSVNIAHVLGFTLPFLGHYWSLAVEEQFYTFWPWVNKLNERNILLFILVFIALFNAIKLMLHFISPDSLLEKIMYMTRFDCMLIGALAAILFRMKNEFFLKITTHKITQVIAWAAIFLVSINMFHIASIFNHQFIAIFTALIILGQITSFGLINLENTIFDFLGKISFGIYVFHPLVIFLLSKIIYVPTSSEFVNYGIVIIAVFSTTIFISYLSYKYFESSFIKMKEKKYSMIQSSSSKH